MPEDNPFGYLIPQDEKLDASATTAGENLSLPDRARQTETSPFKDPRNIMAALIGLGIATQPQAPGQSNLNSALRGLAGAFGTRGGFDQAAEDARQAEVSQQLQLRQQGSQELQNARLLENQRMLTENSIASRRANEQRLGIAEQRALEAQQFQSRQLEILQASQSQIPSLGEYYASRVEASGGFNVPSLQDVAAEWIGTQSLLSQAGQPGADQVMWDKKQNKFIWGNIDALPEPDPDETLDLDLGNALTAFLTQDPTSPVEGETGAQKSLREAKSTRAQKRQLLVAKSIFGENITLADMPRVIKQVQEMSRSDKLAAMSTGQLVKFLRTYGKLMDAQTKRTIQGLIYEKAREKPGTLAHFGAFLSGDLLSGE